LNNVFTFPYSLLKDHYACFSWASLRAARTLSPCMIKTVSQCCIRFWLWGPTVNPKALILSSAFLVLPTHSVLFVFVFIRYTLSSRVFFPSSGANRLVFFQLCWLCFAPFFDSVASYIPPEGKGSMEFRLSGFCISYRYSDYPGSRLRRQTRPSFHYCSLCSLCP